MNNFSRLDLNLLMTLDVLLAEHNVTRAAAAVKPFSTLYQRFSSLSYAIFLTIRCCCQGHAGCARRHALMSYVNLSGGR